MDAHQVFDVEVPVDVSDVRQRVIGAAQDAVDFADVDAVLRSDHDGVECGGSTLKVNQKATLVACGLNRTCKHGEPYQTLLARLFGCAGLRVVFTAKQNG